MHEFMKKSETSAIHARIHNIITISMIIQCSHSYVQHGSSKLHIIINLLLSYYNRIAKM